MRADGMVPAGGLVRVPAGRALRVENLGPVVPGAPVAGRY